MFPRKEDGLEVFIEALTGGSTDNAIRNQEKRGQHQLVNSEVLPEEINSGTREQFEKMGIVFGEKADDLFVYVTLPKGWKKQPTDHDMWSKLVDEHGRERASIFYKAAFYDRKAFMNILRRYVVSSFTPSDENGNVVDHDSATHFATYILDAEKPFNLVAVRIKEYGSNQTSVDEAKARKWLDEHYPNHNDPLAYWEAA